jgi:hypothetical protein
MRLKKLRKKRDVLKIGENWTSYPQEKKSLLLAPIQIIMEWFFFNIGGGGGARR